MAKKLAFDKWMFTSITLLTVFGLAMVASASSPKALGDPVNLQLVKQMLAALLGAVVMGVTMHLDYTWLRRKQVVYGILLATVALLVSVYFMPQLNNVHRWIFIGGVSFQPSELAKLTLVIYLAYLIGSRGEEIEQPTFLVPAGVVMLLLSGLILGQDLGTGGLLLATGALMLFLGGLPLRYVTAAAVIGLGVLVLLIAFEPYRLERVTTFLDPSASPLGGGFQPLQSLIAVGTGGLSGLGPGGSVQKLHFLPHAESDFIFSIICEELGFVGALATLCAFSLLIWRGIVAGLAAPDEFGSALAWGLTGMLGMQALAHVSVALALLPPTGVPLPFISYGGSSLVVTLAASGLLLNVSQHA